MKKNIEYIDKLEFAVKKQYGEEAVTNPAKLWNKEKEENYLEQLKLQDKKDKENNKKKLIFDENGNKQSELKSLKLRKKCNICSKYLLSNKDNLFILKFNSCEECYIKHIEGRNKIGN